MAIETVTQPDLRDTCTALSNKLLHLNSMLLMVTGEGAEMLDDVNKELRANYIWACSSMAGECQDLAESVNNAVHKQTATA